MIGPETSLSLDPRVRFRRFEDEAIVVNQKTAEALVVSAVGTRLLEVIDGNRTLAECAVLLSEEFDAPAERIEQDLLHFAGELVEAGVATVS